MEEQSFKDKNILDQVREYITTRIELTKIELIEKSSKIISKILTGILLSIFTLFILLFLSFGLATYLGQLMDNIAYGYFIVAGIYVIVFVILLLIRKVAFENPIINYQIKKRFKQ